MAYDRPATSPEEVIAFWFDELTPEDWFSSATDLDARITARFSALHLVLARGVGTLWHGTPLNRLAAIIVLDQFPRNIYRGTPLSFATDGLALHEAKLAVEAGADRDLSVGHCCFFYLPFEHSEEIADQDRAVALFEALGDPQYLDYAQRHRAVIREFGRFPHRNALLGRTSTEAEKLYLARPDAGF